MHKNLTRTAYMKSLLLAALLVAISVGISTIVELLFVDFIHGNPHRPQSNAIEMMLLFTPILGAVAFIEIFIVFTPPQLFQSFWADLFVQRFEQREYLGVLAVLPVTALITWYCYDFLTPSNMQLGINAGADWVPYQHGLTTTRYLLALGIQTSMALFTLIRQQISTKPVMQRIMLLSCIVISILSGGAWGYIRAINQYKFL